MGSAVTSWWAGACLRCKPAALCTPTTARSWNSARLRCARVRAGAAYPGDDLVDQVLDAGAGRVQVHPGGGDALLEHRLAGPVVRAVLGGSGADRPRRGHPEALLVAPAVRRRCRGHRGTRRCRRTRSRSSRSTRRRRARARRPGGAVPRRRPRRAGPVARAAAAQSSTAENCGRPTPVIIRVVHIAPGPTPTLTMSAPASTRSRTPSAVTTLPAATGTAGSSLRTARSAEIIRSWWPCAVSTTSVSTPAVQQRRGLAGRRRR